jgi:hypothetical protein
LTIYPLGQCIFRGASHHMSIKCGRQQKTIFERLGQKGSKVTRLAKVTVSFIKFWLQCAGEGIRNRDQASSTPNCFRAAWTKFQFVRYPHPNGLVMTL